MKKSVSSLAVLAAGSLLSFSANSAIINLTFQGTTSSCVNCVAAGTNLSAVYTIDTNDARDSVNGGVKYQTATFTLNDRVFDININNSLDFIYEGTDPEIYRINADSVDTFMASNIFYGFMSFNDFGPVTSNSFRWYSYDTGLEYSGDFSARSATGFGGGDIAFFDGANNLTAKYEINSFSVSTVSAVPVPAAVWLFGSGLVGLAGFARRRA